MAAKLVRLYLFLAVLFNAGFTFISATYVLFLTSRGLDLFETNLVNVVFMTTLFLAEIPTGAIADTWGRKASFVIANLLLGLGMLLYFCGKSFWGFALAEAVSAVGMTCMTGAFQAWFVDALKHQGFAEPLDKIFVREQQLTRSLSIAGALTGAYLGQRDLALPWLAGSGVFFLTALIAAFVMREYGFVAKTFSLRQGVKNISRVISESLAFAKTQPEVRWILGTSLVQFFAVQAPNMQWQIRFAQHLQTSQLGIVWTSMSLAMLIGASGAHKVLTRLGNNRRLMLSLTQLGISFGILLAAASQSFWPLLASFLLHEVFRGAFRPVNDAFLNEQIPADKRATLLSFGAMANHVGSVLGLLVSGLLAERLSISSAWMLSGAVLAGYSLLLLRQNSRQ